MTSKILSVRLSRSLAALWLGAALAAQVPSWSPEFAAAGLGGRVFACATWNNELHAGGTWFAARGGVIKCIARFDGQAWRPLSTGVDLVAAAMPFAEPQVRAMAVFNGELVIAGTFDRAGGQAVDHIARWNGTAFQPLGAGLQLSFGDADVRGLAVYQGELYAAGLFDRAGGAPVNGIARWDGSTWRAAGTGVTDSMSGTVGHPRALHVHGSALVVGGEFDRAGGLPANRIASWNGSAWSALGAGALSTVYALETFGTLLVAAGPFQVGPVASMLAAWNGSAWSALGQGGPDLPVLALRSLGGQLWAGGQFVRPGPYLARFDGTSWSSAGGVAGVYSGIAGTSVFTLHAQGTELILGGEFTTAGADPGATGAVASANVVAFDGAAFRPLGAGLGLDRQAQQLLPWRNGLIAAGYFTEAGTVRALSVAFYDGDRWQPLGRFDGGVGAAAVFQGSLVVSGAFTSIDGQPFPGIAQHDGVQWRAFGGIAPPRLHAHAGDLYGFGATGLLRWNGTGFVTVALAADVVSHLHTHRDGLLYVTTDNAFTHRVYVWDGTQAVQIGSANDFIHAISSFGSEIVVGGRFTAVGGTPAVLMARWNGTSWRSMPAPVSGYSTDAFCELDGVLHAAVNGDPRGFLLKLAGGTWQALGSGPDGVPQLLSVDRATASILASGAILTAGGLPSRSLAEWRTQPAWRNRLHGTPGAAGVPLLMGRGAMQGGTPVAWTIEGPPNAPVLFGLGTSRIDQPLLGGVLVPSPDAIVFLLADARGVASLGLQVPPGFGPGADFFSQAWLLDPSGPQGLTATNALQCTSQ